MLRLFYEKKKEIIPAILEKKFFKIKEKYILLKKSFNKKNRMFFVQIDICDGKLTPEKTFLSNGRLDSFKKLRKVSQNFLLELDINNGF